MKKRNYEEHTIRKIATSEKERAMLKTKKYEYTNLLLSMSIFNSLQQNDDAREAIVKEFLEASNLKNSNISR